MACWCAPRPRGAGSPSWPGAPRSRRCPACWRCCDGRALPAQPGAGQAPTRRRSVPTAPWPISASRSRWSSPRASSSPPRRAAAGRRRRCRRGVAGPGGAWHRARTAREEADGHRRSRPRHGRGGGHRRRPPTDDRGHNSAPMEPHAAIAAWDGDRLTLRGSYQMLNYNRNELADCLGDRSRQGAHPVALRRRRLRLQARHRARGGGRGHRGARAGPPGRRRADAGSRSSRR